MTPCSSPSPRSTTSTLCSSRRAKPSTTARSGRTSSPSPTALPSSCTSWSPTSCSGDERFSWESDVHVGLAAWRARRRDLADVAFTVVDLETTGATPGFAKITEIGAVRLEGGREVGTFSSLVNPGVRIPAMITGITGIDDATVADAPPIDVVLPRFVDFAADSVLVAHNAHFDLGFLDYELGRLQRRTFPRPALDTLRLARKLCPQQRCSLNALSYRFDTQGEARAPRPAGRAGHGRAPAPLPQLAAGAGHEHARGGGALLRAGGAPQLPQDLAHGDAAHHARRVRDARREGRRPLHRQGREPAAPHARPLPAAPGLPRPPGAGAAATASTSSRRAPSSAPCCSSSGSSRRHRPPYNSHGTRVPSYHYVKLSADEYPRLYATPNLRDDGSLLRRAVPQGQPGPAPRRVPQRRVPAAHLRAPAGDDRGGRQARPRRPRLPARRHRRLPGALQPAPQRRVRGRGRRGAPRPRGARRAISTSACRSARPAWCRPWRSSRRRACRSSARRWSARCAPCAACAPRRRDDAVIAYPAKRARLGRALGRARRPHRRGARGRPRSLRRGRRARPARRARRGRSAGAAPAGGRCSTRCCSCTPGCRATARRRTCSTCAPVDGRRPAGSRRARPRDSRRRARAACAPAPPYSSSALPRPRRSTQHRHDGHDRHGHGDDHVVDQAVAAAAAAGLCGGDLGPQVQVRVDVVVDERHGAAAFGHLRPALPLVGVVGLELLLVVGHDAAAPRA